MAMASIRIKNIGPLKDTGVVKLTHIMLVIGEQSTGKSTFLKIVSFCRWLEKKAMLGEYLDKPQHVQFDLFNNWISDGWVAELQEFHSLSNEYFTKDSYFEYKGDAVTIVFQDFFGSLALTENFEKVRHNTKLSYIPAERNLLSVIPRIEDKYRSSTFNSMFNFVMEFSEANKRFTRQSPLRLAFADNMEYYHDEYNDYVRLVDKAEESSLQLEYASSGVKAALPLNVIVHYLCGIAGSPSKRTPKMVSSNPELSFMDDMRTNRTNVYNYPQLFIEEPEQHLYPASQAKLVRYIITKFSEAAKRTGQPGYVLMTSHSPYILTQINLLLKAQRAHRVNADAVTKLLPQQCILPLSYYSAFFINGDGVMKNMIDKETKLVKGEYLDAVSEETEDLMNRLNDIIYG